ncbi:MAG: hypothetical protein ACRBBR_08785 [Cellvibrionaceae bacterium]
MTILVTVVLTVVILALLFGLFLWVKMPFYRVDKDKMVKVLEMVLTGQARENDWRMVFDMTIRHNPELESLRQQALEIEEQYFTGLSANSDYLFTQQGLGKLENLLQAVKNMD